MERRDDMAVFLKPDREYNANGVTVKVYDIIAHNDNRINMPFKRDRKLRGVPYTTPKR